MWQFDDDLGVQTHMKNTFGYLAPEHNQNVQITDKSDVYSFGVVLLELVTGQKAVDMNRPEGQQCITEWILAWRVGILSMRCTACCMQHQNAYEQTLTIGHVCPRWFEY
eukprot:c15202_g1_i1 orf=408-734(-)